MAGARIARAPAYMRVRQPLRRQVLTACGGSAGSGATRAERAYCAILSGRAARGLEWRAATLVLAETLATRGFAPGAARATRFFVPRAVATRVVVAAGPLSKTDRQPGLSCALARIRQATIGSRLGI